MPSGKMQMRCRNSRACCNGLRTLPITMTRHISGFLVQRLSRCRSTDEQLQAANPLAAEGTWAFHPGFQPGALPDFEISAAKIVPCMQVLKHVASLRELARNLAG